MRLEKWPTLLAGCLLALLSVNAAAQFDPLARVRPPEPNAAKIAPSPDGALVVKTVNFRDLAAQTTALVNQGINPMANYVRLNVPAHRLPNGKTTAVTNKRADHNPVLPTVIPQAVGVQSLIAPKTSVTPPPVGGFVGLSTADNVAGFGSELEPPDQGLAANNGKVLEATNLMIQLYDAASGNPDIQFDNGSYAAAVPLTTFFADLGVFSDPQVFFDPTLSAPSDLTAAAKGRWVVTAISHDGTSPDVFYIDVAVSQSSDARGNWTVYRIHTFSSDISSIFSSCNGADCLPDYPKMGFDANGFYISVNLFNWNNDYGFVGAATYVLPKAKMRDAQSIYFLRVFYSDPLTNAPSFLVQPSMLAPGQTPVTARGGTEYLLEARKLIDNSNHIRVWAIENTSALVADASCSPGPGICAINVHFADVATPSTVGTVAAPTAGYYAGFAFNAQQPNQPGPWSTANLGFASDIDAGYGGFQSTIQYANGKLFGVLTTANPSWAVGGTAGNLLSWYSIAPLVNGTSGAVSASLSAKGTIVPPAGYFVQFPAMALLRSGTGVIGFSIMNPNLNVPGNFPSTGYIRFTGSATLGNLVVTGQGQAADDGFTQWYSGANTGRWGDYGAAVVDPFAALTGVPVFYTGNEMIATPYTQMKNLAGNTYFANWSTFISVIH
jgi:hypothetical protein